MPEYIAIEAPADVIGDVVAEIEEQDGLSLGTRRPLDSPADALDAPINPDDIKTIFETVTVMIQTGGAGIALWEAIRRVRGRGKSVVVRDPSTGKELADAA